MTQEELDKLAAQRTIDRKVSLTKTEECTVYNRWDNLWEESDADLRKRILEMKK